MALPRDGTTPFQAFLHLARSITSRPSCPSRSGSGRAAGKEEELLEEGRDGDRKGARLTSFIKERRAGRRHESASRRGRGREEEEERTSLVSQSSRVR